jgi:hypothetical protein
MDEVPEEAIEVAEDRPSTHEHGALDDEGLVEHLRSRHGLDVPGPLSRSTAEGLHDRLHDETDAVGDSQNS